MAEKERKHWSEKCTTEMDFQEFVKWAESYIVEEFLRDGLKGIRHGVHMITDQASRNEVFGGEQKHKK